MTSMRLFAVLTLMLALVCWSACTKDDTNDCNTDNISFSADISPVIQQNCFGGCHNGNNPSGGFTLESYGDVKAAVDQGRLYGAVAREAGFVAMPPTGSGLDDCQLQQLQAWINQGAQDN